MGVMVETLIKLDIPLVFLDKEKHTTKILPNLALSSLSTSNGETYIFSSSLVFVGVPK